MSNKLSEEKHPGILDNDPALDIILLEEMEKDEKRAPPNQGGGCLSLLLFCLLPAGILFLGLIS
ncbi:MAG TPA: hypothetical protein ENN79_10965 [Desulfobacteraceae bacterium]|nr:hypothetical protein [Desulfobacteraceae bacterium]